MDNQAGFFMLMTVATMLILVGCIGLYARLKGKKISATISNVDMYGVGVNPQHQTYVNYEYNGQTYTDVRLNFWTAWYYPGKIINIYVIPENPNKPISGSLTYLILGIIIAIISFFIIL